MNSSRYDFPVVLIQSGLERDHFAGLDRLLAERGIRSARVLPDQPLPRLTPANRVILISESRSVMSRLSIRQAARTGAHVIHVRSDPGDEPEQETVAGLLGDRFAAVDMFHEEPKTGSARALMQRVIELLGREPERECPVVDGGVLCRAALPAARARGTRPVVVNCVVCHDSPVGGVGSWAVRLARGFAEHDYGFEVRTLFVATDPEAFDRYRADLPTDDTTDVCVIDPADDQIACMGNMRAAMERVAGSRPPSIVIPNYSDIAYAAAMQLSRHGTRVLTIAHTDDAYYRSLLDTYTRFDGIVGVSKACMEWVRAKAGPAIDNGTIPAAQIACCGPVAASPRHVPSDGPLTLAYVGRMVQTQKRIFDLLRLVDELNRLGVRHVLHMIGDGADLAGWRRAWEGRAGGVGRVEFHGRREPTWVQDFLVNVDVSVLVSEAEGTSVTMLEAMGAGVVPAVTAVKSGVSEWVRDGENGIVSPVGEPEAMARRLAALSADRARLGMMGEAAWRHAKEHMSIGAMCARYAAVFGAMLERRVTPGCEPPSDEGVVLNEEWRWSKLWCEDGAGARMLLDRWLAEAGYSRPAWGTYRAGCDCVVVDAEHEPVTPVMARQIEAWRAEGLGVAVWPHLLRPARDGNCRGGLATPAERLVSAAEGAVKEGCRRLVVYGIGKHTRRVPGVFARGLPIVGLMDDVMPPWEMMFGLPIVRRDEVMEELRPDGVILSSDAWEETMWNRTAGLREQGVRVMRLYGVKEEAEEHVGRV